jgi:hypothetical protein
MINVSPPPTDPSAHDIVKLTVEIGYRQAASKLGWSRSRLYDFISKKHQKLYSTLVESSDRFQKKSPNNKPDVRLDKESDRAKLRPTHAKDVINEVPRNGKGLPKTSEKDKLSNSKASPVAIMLATHVGERIFDQQHRDTKERQKNEKREAIERRNKGLPPAIPPQALENRERVVSTSISRSRGGQILAHPWRKRVPRRIEPGTTLLAFQKEEFVIVAWSDGRDVGNGCLNLVLARPKHAKEIDAYWRHNGLESRYIFKKLSKEFYVGTPAEDIPELQGGEEIIDPSTNQTVGYYHVPAATSVPDYYLITEGPFGH